MKAQHSQHVRQSAIVMDLSDLEHEAAAIIAKAQAEAGRLLAHARTHAEKETAQIREAARAAGYQEGLDAGLQQGRKQGQEETLAATATQLKDLTSRWSQTLELLHQHMPAHVADAKIDLVRLALSIASRITHQEALKNRQVAPAIVEETLRMVGNVRRVALHVNPLELDILQEFLPELLTKLRSMEEIELNPDDAVPAGGCVLRFGSGQIDAKIETQINRISDELLGNPDEKATP